MGLYCRNKEGNFPAGNAITTHYELLERENHPQSQPIQQAELHALIRACQLSRQSVNIYTDN